MTNHSPAVIPEWRSRNKPWCGPKTKGKTKKGLGETTLQVRHLHTAHSKALSHAHSQLTFDPWDSVIVPHKPTRRGSHQENKI